jgi:predicted lysophospholipase L1 biosynthesis ABC-type transport system permease subunit
VADLKRRAAFGYRLDVSPHIYFAFAQHPTPLTTVVVRSSADPQVVLPGIRAAVASLDPTLPARNLQTAQQLVARLLQTQSQYARLLGIFAALATILAMTGIHGLTAFSTNQRTREFAIRLAVGAKLLPVLLLALRFILACVLTGIAAGTAAVLAFGRILESFLYGVTVTDVTTLLATGFLMLSAALFALLAPLLRLARIQPMDILRHE